MKILTVLTILFLLAVPKSTMAAGFSDATFDMVALGTVFVGVSPVFSSSTYEASATSRYTSWGYQATAGYDYPLTDFLGARGYASYARTTGSNTANQDTVYESITQSDLEFGLMATATGWAVGGGVISRSAGFDYVNGQSTVSKSYSGLLKFAKASLDFRSQGGSVGFSISESYHFGNVGEDSEIKVAEWKTLFNIFYLLNLK
jgi:hypothetical protein